MSHFGYDQVSVYGSSLRTNSDKNIRDLLNLVRPELMLVTGPQHTGLLGLWKILISFFAELSLKWPNLPIFDLGYIFI
jgi:hypothetical protein